VRKLLGGCSLPALHGCDLDGVLDRARHATLLDDYTDALAPLLHVAARAVRNVGNNYGNSYGDSVGDLATGLLFELQAQPAFWHAFAAALVSEHAKQGPFWQAPAGDALLRKKVNDMYATLRDQVDADNYTAATGQPCSANRIYTYRMLDMAYRAIEQVFAGWPGSAAQIGVILGRPADVMPIEIRQLKSIAACRPEWIVRWSASLETFTGSPGPLHTRSKRFASLANSVEKIGAMLLEIGGYEQLSANGDGATWLRDAQDATDWLDDLARVEAESRAADGAAVCPSPRYDGMEAALTSLRAEALPVRQAVFLKLLRPCDDSYPIDWCVGGALPTLAQLALAAGVSVPTLRKRRDGAIAQLYGRTNNKDGK
jgi:hypothetical protein